MVPNRSLQLGLILVTALGVACGSDADGGPGAAAGSSGSFAGNPGAAGSTSAGASSGGNTGLAGSTSFAGSTSAAGSTSSGGSSNVAGSTNNAGTSAGGSTGSAGSAGTGAGGNAAGSSGAGGASGSNCPAVDPLKTNSQKVDAYDCAILAVAAKWSMPDPMIVKSQIQQESNFQIFATSGDSPCGTMQGWTDAESKSFGLIQTTPACGESKSALLPNGHPNLNKDMASALWATSVFNPTVNLDEGVKTDADNRKELKAKYKTCTEAQYNMMAAAAFNSGTSAVLGCTSYNARAQMYVTYITGHYHGFAKSAGWPDPY